MAEKHFNICDMFELVADAVGEREALVCGDSRITYTQLEERANQMAHYLSAQGVKAGQHVALYMYNCSEYLEGMLACFKIRAVPINVNYRYVNEELSYIFDNADVVACIHHREFIPAINEIKGQFPELKTFVSVDDATDHDLSLIGATEYENAMSDQSNVRDFEERSGQDLFILYTGGTTGMPKGVMWPHEHVFHAAMGGGGFYSGEKGPCQKPEDIIDRMPGFEMASLPLAPLMHGASWWFACITLLAGNKLVMNPERNLNGEVVWGLVEQEAVNSVQIVGDAMAIPLLEALDNNPGRWKLDSVFNVGSGGAVFSYAKQDAFKKHFPNVFITNSFGSSESGSMGMDTGSKKEEASLGNVNRSEFMDVIVEGETPEQARHAKPGETGIFSRSGHIPAGYYNDPVKTAKTFIDVEGKGKTWLLTGDAARLEEDGSITIFGRDSNCINSGGEKIFPEEVEQALKNNPAIIDCLVVETPDERFHAKVTAVVTLKEGHDVSLKSVQEEARKHIAGYKIPRELHVVAQMPRTPSGKPSYKETRDIALSKENQVG
ncbi:acyl-CoA synthetase [Endozoicomonas numazuensis]|uniref:AMP-binding protein n=1 Tax=Endozoicomonas numazuensis TaxID=1137799 RepID=A0A081NMN5_9GAMM|nr:acyl-CoA synthetase [Endozoicomonas numazuensis]KEQ19708.1 AMP-binding protein [Endozoicomonas numazuensis]